MEKIERDVRPNQVAFDYPTMSEEELMAYGAKVIPRAADNCHFFLWTTEHFLPLAFDLLEEWDLRYVLNFVWHKPGGFQPVGLPQFNCEFVMYARRGTPKFIDTKGFPCCFEGPRREHSRKPDNFYEMIARVTRGRRADWFARAPREGFEVIGNETNKFAETAT
jgi:N6-adenosine-specific RNA methylase IME4